MDCPVDCTMFVNIRVLYPLNVNSTALSVVTNKNVLWTLPTSSGMGSMGGSITLNREPLVQAVALVLTEKKLLKSQKGS